MSLSRNTRTGNRFQIFHALRNSNFRWFWLNGAAQAMAQGMQFLILVLLVLELTGDSASKAGLVIFVYGIPNLFFAMLGGVIADRADRLRLLISTRLCVSVLILALAILEISGLVEIWHVYIIMFLLGTVQALNMPARMALVADLVEREDMMNAVALHTMVNQTGQIIGPALAGGLIVLLGLGLTLLVNAGLYLVGIVFLLMIKGLPPRAPAANATVLGDLKAGMNSIRSTPMLYTIIGIAIAFAFFGMSHRQILPAFTKEVLEVGAGGTGFLLLGAGLGSLTGSLILASMGDFRHKTWLLIGSVLSLSVFLTLFAWSPWYTASWIMMFFVGLTSFGFFWPLATTLIQLNVQPELRGRVLSFLQFAPAVHYLGALPIAVAADVINWPAAITGGAAMSLVVALWLGIWRPTLLRSEASPSRAAL